MNSQNFKPDYYVQKTTGIPNWFNFVSVNTYIVRECHSKWFEIIIQAFYFLMANHKERKIEIELQRHHNFIRAEQRTNIVLLPNNMIIMKSNFECRLFIAKHQSITYLISIWEIFEYFCNFVTQVFFYKQEWDRVNWMSKVCNPEIVLQRLEN